MCVAPALSCGKLVKDRTGRGPWHIVEDTGTVVEDADIVVVVLQLYGTY